MKVKEVKYSEGIHHSWAIKCPGCGDYHLFDDRWGFNGDMEKPTFKPSMKATYLPHDCPQRICHSTITDGRIQFHSDCTHDMVGQTLDLPDIDPLWNEERG